MVEVVLTGACLLAGSAPALACMHCAAAGGCALGGAYDVCISGKFFDSPYCVSYGDCSSGGGGGWDDTGSVRPRHGVQPVAPSSESTPRALGDALSSVDESVLTLYALRMPLDPGFEPFAPGQLSWVVRAVASSRTARGMLAAIGARSGRVAETISVCEEYSTLAARAFVLPLAASDGSGYVLRVEASAGGTRVRVCAVRDRTLAGALADVTLAENDLLCVRVEGGGHAYALALTPRLIRVASGEDADAERPARQQFDAEAGLLTARAFDDGVRFQLLEVPADFCH